MDKLDGIEKRKVMEMMKTNQTGAITLDWMYREEKPDSEEYLLGKEVDKHIEGEPVGTIEDEFDAKFGERIKANIALDMATKMREDPLFIIKQKEVEARKKIVQNPIKMKQLQAMIEKQKKKQEKKDKKKKKKKHKKKDDDSDSDSDDYLVAQYLSILSKKNKLGSSGDGKKDRKKWRDQKSEDSDSDKHYQQKSQDNRLRDKLNDHSRERGTHKGRGHDQYGHRSNRYEHKYQENRNEMKNSERGRSMENRDDTQYSERDHRTRYNEQRERHSDNRKNERTDSRKTHKIDRHRSSSNDSQTVTHKRTNRDRKRVQSNERDDSRHSRDRREDQKNSQKGKISQKHKECSTSSSSDSSDEEQNVHKKSQDRERDRRSDKKNGRKDDSSPEMKRQRKHSGGDGDVRPKPYGLILSANHQPRHRSKSPRQQKQKSPEKRKKSPETKRHRSPKRKSPKRPLTEEERERKLAEMMDNAKWRNEQRKKNVNRYKDEDKREQDEIINDHKTSFVNDMMSEHASKSSLEDRLNRNKHNIQRTRHALEKNFLKK